jgi:hypothetical protein
VNTLDHLPPLPLFVDYRSTKRIRYYDATILTEQDESVIYHALQFHNRVRHIDLDLVPSILHKVLVLMDKHFPMLEHLSLSSSDANGIHLTLPKAFLAPNLRHLSLPSTILPKRLRLLTSTVTDLQGPPSERTPEEKLWDFKTRAQQYARDRGSCDDVRISYLEFLETEAEDDLALARMIAG